MQIQSDRATATVQLRDANGTVVTQTLTLERDHGQWGITNP